MQGSDADAERSDDEETDGSLEKDCLGRDHDDNKSGFLQKLTLLLTGLQIVLGAFLGTAGKIVAIVLLGLAGKSTLKRCFLHVDLKNHNNI